MRIQTKITLLFVIISTGGLMLLHSAIFYFVSEFNFEDFFKRIEARVKLAAQINIYPSERSAAFKDIRNQYLEKLEAEQDFIIRVQNGEFNKPLPLPDEFYNEIIVKKKARYNEQNRFYAGSYFTSPGGNYLIIVAAEDPYGFKELEQLKKILIILFAVAVILTYIAGAVFSHYITKPVRGIIKSVKNIGANNLHERLPELDNSDEIAELVLTINHTLDRLETAFETQNNFISNASHELRTPLSIIISEAEIVLSGKQELSEANASTKTILNEAGKLEQILSSLLALAQSGFDGKKQNWQNIRIDELVMEVFDSVKKIELESRLHLDFDGLPADEQLLYVEGNSNLLKLAISNIILNACKYSSNQPVTIKVVVEGRRVKVIVIDKGIGIPREDVQHIFEPFFRASNANRFEGYGIGLPLTLNIIRLHKGTIGISSQEQIGTEIQLILPVARS